MRLAELTLPLGLSALGIEGRIQRICISCLQPTFMLDPDKQFVVKTDILIIAADDQIIVGTLRRSALELQIPNRF